MVLYNWQSYRIGALRGGSPSILSRIVPKAFAHLVLYLHHILSQQIVIRPFDASAINEIVKAIQASDVGLAPNNDGKLVRLNIPPLSTERRKQLVSRVKEFAEEARVSIRNIRRDANKHADQSEKDKLFSEDERDDVKDKVQELTKKHEGLVNDAAAAKEKDIMDE